MVLGNTSITNTSAINLESTSIQIGLKNSVPINGITQVTNTNYTDYKQYAVISTDSEINFSNTDGLKLNGILYNNASLDLTPYNKLYPYSSISKSFNFVNINPAVKSSTSPNFAFSSNNNPIFDLTTSLLDNCGFSLSGDAPFRVGAMITSNISATDKIINVNETAGFPNIGNLLLRPSTAATTVINAVVASSSNKTVVVNSSSTTFVAGDYVSGVSSTGSYHFVLGKIESVSTSGSTVTLVMLTPISANIDVGSNIYKLEVAPYTNKSDTSFTLSSRGSNASAITADSTSMQIFNRDPVSTSNLFYFCDNPDSSLYTLSISTIMNDTLKNYCPLFDISPIGLKMNGVNFFVWKFDPTCTSVKSFTVKDATIGAIQANTTVDNLFGFDFNFCDEASNDASKGIKL
jgi:hypothetical protein